LLLIAPARAADVSTDKLPMVDLSDLVIALFPANGFATMDWD
jgi:hypothetical protein